MKVLITGASGLIGTALRRSLETDDHQVVRLVRRGPVDESKRLWDPTNATLNPADVEGFDAVVHLAGAGIGDSRWTPARKQLILDSRVMATELLSQTLATATHPPAVFISGSAIGYYGDRPDPVAEEDGPSPSPDFLSDLCVAWEAATAPAEAAGIRTAHIRTGIVLATSGGALGKLLLPFRLGLGGRLGSGKTWWSWISIDDEVRAIRHVIDSQIGGAVNLTAPQAVTVSEFTKTLGKVLRRPAFVPVPRFALELLLGKELAAALLFTSARVVPEKLDEAGFEFEYTTIEQGLRAAIEDS